jgi:DNA-binding FadR family transcriptional regulator
MSEPGSLIRSLVGQSTARNFHSFVINEIGSAIVSGRYPIGSVLPNDAEMLGKFDVSRTVLREALKTLESKGLLEARPKVGTKVAPRNRWNYFDPMLLGWLFHAGPNEQLLRSVTNMRLALEPYAAAEIATSHSTDQIRLMRYWLNQMEVSLNSPLNFALADFEIHLIIADNSKNQFSRSLMPLIEFSHATVYQSAIVQMTSARTSQIELHAKLVEAIADGSSSDAVITMNAIIRAEAEGLTD